MSDEARCSDCAGPIVRRSRAPVADEPLCLPCFTRRFAAVTIETMRDFVDADLDRLPVGAILLDRELRVVGYNAAERALTGLSAERVLGRHFFREIAPCLSVQEIEAWCVSHLDDPDIQLLDLDWILELKSGRRLASLRLTAGRGLVSLQIDT